jgi:hypothetical protein
MLAASKNVRLPGRIGSERRMVKMVLLAALSSLGSVRQPVEKCSTYLLTDACQFDILFCRRGIKRLSATNLWRHHLSYAMVLSAVI